MDFSNSLNPGAQVLSRLQESLGVLPHSHTGRGTGEDQVTRTEFHNLREELDQLGYRANHVGRGAVLLRLTIDIGAKSDGVGISELIRAHNPGARGSKSGEGLTQAVLGSLTELLTNALGEVLSDGDTSDMLPSVLGFDVATALTDDDDEFTLPVDVSVVRQNNFGVRPAER
jgi:hypothetical protein